VSTEQKAHKTALFEQFARVAKALASPARLQLLDLLTQAERSVEALAQAAGMQLGNTSAQLRQLRDAGLVTARRDGVHVYYRLAGQDAAALYAALRDVAHAHLAAARAARAAYLGLGVDEPTTEAVDRDELRRRLQAGTVRLLDVRPALEHAAGHIPGAISIPLDELPGRLHELAGDQDQDQELIVYCRGAYCVLAHDAVRLLAAHGRTAWALGDGLLEWRLAGLPVAVGTARPARAAASAPTWAAP